MQRVAIPGTELRVSRISMGLGGFGTRTQGEAAIRLLETYLNAGGNFVDTAHCYGCWMPGGNGASERLLGEAMQVLGCREQLVIGTKGGHPTFGTEYQRPDTYLAPDLIRSDLDESLQRLRTANVELYYLHRDDPRVPVSEIMDSLAAEVAAQRVRYIACSNWRTTRIEAANAYARSRGLPRFVASQLRWSLAESRNVDGPDPTTRYVTPPVAAWHAESGLPITAYSSTGGGFFADPPRDSTQYDLPINFERRERARELARSRGCTPTEVALAYLLHQPGLAIPILGTANPEHLVEELRSPELHLSAAELSWLAGTESKGSG
jgi:aryl-alcohol dehydrogenase-like predicted oxidoreductase